MIHLLLAIPLMDEWDNLSFLLQDLNRQTYRHFTAVFCVNQPDSWWYREDKSAVCHNNSLSIDLLKSCSDFPIRVIDRSSPGKGWTGKEYGVGWARKTALDECSALALPGDIIISMDGDTRINPGYLSSVLDTLSQHPDAVGVSVPYYHLLTGSEKEDKAMLRYEIYMRYYVLNLWRINSPYSFTALGSAMAFPVISYRAIRGMTPNKSGEDFYFLQKLCKYGPLLFWNPEKVYPQARFSDRVFFGTGPAMIKGNDNDWSSYPIYSMKSFDSIAETYSLFPKLYEYTVPTPLDDFLFNTFHEQDIWEPLRVNHPRRERFIRACHEKLDGLRILQYLKSVNTSGNAEDETRLKEYLLKYPGKEEMISILFPGGFTFAGATVNQLDSLRNVLAAKEEEYQKAHYNTFSHVDHSLRPDSSR